MYLHKDNLAIRNATTDDAQIGCKLANEVDKDLFELEADDIHMEVII